MSWTKLLFSIEGRISRGGFWLAVFLLCGFWFAVSAVALTMDDSEIRAVATMLLIPTIYPLACITIKRCHDRDKTAWWALFCLIPVFGQLWLVMELGLMKGTPFRNDYGRRLDI